MSVIVAFLWDPYLFSKLYIVNGVAAVLQHTSLRALIQQHLLGSFLYLKYGMLGVLSVLNIIYDSLGPYINY